MYVTRVDAQIVDVREPWYVRIGENGCWQRCSEGDAQALSVNGTLYRLPDGDEVPDHEGAPVAVVTVEDDGAVAMEAVTRAETLELQVAQLEQALCEMAIGGAA